MPYLSSQVNAVRDFYKPNDSLDFLMDFSGMRIKPDTVEITGTFQAISDNTVAAIPPALYPVYTPPTNTQTIYMDPVTGIDAIFQSVTVSFNDRIVETINNYPRLVKMKKIATKSPAMLSGEASQVSAFRCYEEDQTAINVRVQTRKFSVNLSNCLNLNSGLSYSKTGQIKVSIILAQSKDVFYGADVTDIVSYQLANLQLNYKTEIDNNNPTEIIVNTVLKQNLNSANANLIMLLPLPTGKISSSMISTDNLNLITANSLEMEKPNKVSRVELQLNDSLNNVVSYPLESEQEILEQFLDSYGDKKSNMCKVSDLLVRKNFGIGYSFTKALQNQKASMKIESDLTTPYTIYMVYETAMTL